MFTNPYTSDISPAYPHTPTIAKLGSEMSDYPSKFHAVDLKPDGVLHVRINRPKILNAMHKGAYLEFGDIFRQAGDDSEVRAIVLNGEGRALCAGLDVAGMAPEMQNGPDERSRAAIKLAQTIRGFQDSISQPYFINKPVISVSHGPCIGLAIDIITATDIRFASEDSTLSVREIELGMAADIGTLQRLPKLVNNLGWVKDVCFTGRNFDAKEAYAQGLIQRVYKTKEEAVDAALVLASQLAAKSPVAMYGTKKSINYALDHTHAESLEQIAEFNSYGLGDDFMEGCLAMLESTRTKKKVTPTYSKL